MIPHGARPRPRYFPGAVLAAYNRSRRTRTVVIGPTSLTGKEWHGTTYGYARGCSCEPCRQANAEAQRKKRARDRHAA